MARLAIAGGAREVEIEIAAQRLVMTARGVHLERKTVSDFASVLDHVLEPADRHQAMVELEERDAFVLSVIACSRLKSMTLQTGGEEGMKLERTADGTLSVRNPGEAALDRPDLHLEVRGLRIDARRAAKWLGRLGRFAPVALSVNGRRVDRGFDEPMIVRRLDPSPADNERRGPKAMPGAPPPPIPMPAVLAIPHHGSAPRLWLLRHGIITTRATVPGYPSFEAAVEMGSLATAGHAATGAELREALAVHIDAILDAAVCLTLRLAREGASRDGGRLRGAVRSRVARLLLEAARKRRRVPEISGVPIFPLVSAGGRRRVSIDEIRRSVRLEAGGICALDAIPSGEAPGKFAFGERGALILSGAERALLGELLSVVFSAPPTRLRRSAGRRLLDFLAAGPPTLRFTRRRTVAVSELTAAERELLSRLCATLADGGGIAPAVTFHRGGGAVLRTRDGLSLPRSSPEVRRSLRAVARDPAWLYPAMACLLEGPDLVASGAPGAEARRQWHATSSPVS